MSFCVVHKLAQGYGAQGDGYVCVKCGRASYFRGFNALVLPERKDEMHFLEYPFIRRFPEPISWRTNEDTWTHHWDRHGKLQPRENLR